MGERQIKQQPAPEADRTGDGTDQQHPSGGLYADADLSKRHVAQTGKVQIDVEGTYGSEADFLRSAPKELRHQLHLPADASTEQVYHKMARDFLKALPGASSEMQAEGLANLNLSRDQLTEQNVYNAMIARDRHDSDTAAGAPLSELEKNMNKLVYKKMKDGTMPNIYD